MHTASHRAYLLTNSTPLRCLGRTGSRPTERSEICPQAAEHAAARPLLLLLQDPGNYNAAHIPYFHCPRRPSIFGSRLWLLWHHHRPSESRKQKPQHHWDPLQLMRIGSSDSRLRLATNSFEGCSRWEEKNNLNYLRGLSLEHGNDNAREATACEGCRPWVGHTQRDWQHAPHAPQEAAALGETIDIL